MRRRLCAVRSVGPPALQLEMWGHLFCGSECGPLLCGSVCGAACLRLGTWGHLFCGLACSAAGNALPLVLCSAGDTWPLALYSEWCAFGINRFVNVAVVGMMSQACSSLPAAIHFYVPPAVAPPFSRPLAVFRRPIRCLNGGSCNSPPLHFEGRRNLASTPCTVTTVTAMTARRGSRHFVLSDGGCMLAWQSWL